MTAKALRLGRFAQRTMAACVRLPWWLNPLKALWIAACLLLLERKFMRHYQPQVRSRYGFVLAGSSTSSMLARVLHYRGVFEPALSSAIDQLVRPGDVCVDAGANVGYFSLLMASKAAATGQVIAIEASPGNVGKLQANLAANSSSDSADTFSSASARAQVRVVSAACADFEGTATFYVHRQNDMHCRLQLPRKNELDYWLMGRGQATHWRPITVPVHTLPSLLGDQAAQVKFIKLDIEGAEHLVSEALIAACTDPELIVALEAKTPHIRATLAPFERAGFYAYNLHNNYLWLISDASDASAALTASPYADLYGCRYMVDVLLSRQPLHTLDGVMTRRCAA